MSSVKPLVFGAPRLEYLKCVMNDPELKLRVAQIHQQIDAVDDNRFTLKMGDEYPIPYIGTHPVRQISDEVIKEIGKIEIDFELGSYETISLLNYELPKPEGQSKKVLFSTENLNEDSPKILRMYILRDATKREIIDSLKDIDKRIEKAYGVRAKKRTKGPENYQLVYAIHREKRNGKKFSEIFRQYGLGELANYRGARGIYSLDKFREYYRKYEPHEPSRGRWVLDADSETITDGRGFIPPTPPG